MNIYNMNWRGYFGQIKVVTTIGQFRRHGEWVNRYECFIFMPYQYAPIFYYGNKGGYTLETIALAEAERFIRCYYKKLDPTYTRDVPVSFDLETSDEWDTLTSRMLRPKYCLFPKQLRELSKSKDFHRFLDGLQA